MPKERENQNRWKMSLEPRVVEVLEETAERLRLSWERDIQHPKSYPVNTDYALRETEADLRPPPQVQRSAKGLPAPAPRAKSVHELIDESTVKRLYEQQHADSYSRALKQASEGYGRGYAAWKQIVNCLRVAYLIEFGGDDFIPKPKVHFLHRELLGIAESLELDHLIKEGLVEFFDDICPCGKKHNAEAIRKLGKRLTKSRGTWKL